jgi:hypothetical protein
MIPPSPAGLRRIHGRKYYKKQTTHACKYLDHDLITSDFNSPQLDLVDSSAQSLHDPDLHQQLLLLLASCAAIVSSTI